MRLLIVEDNLRIGRLIAEGLGQRGFACDTAGTLEEAEASLASAQFDAMVLDLGLPDGDGVDWLRGRGESQRVPTIILTARGGLRDRIVGLDAGSFPKARREANSPSARNRLNASKPLSLLSARKKGRPPESQRAVFFVAASSRRRLRNIGRRSCVCAA